jgi:pimeloyl-ACP methyl ester carboxylesterase
MSQDFEGADSGKVPRSATPAFGEGFAPICLVHGALADERMWTPVLRELPFARAISLAHFGASPAPSHRGFGLASHAEDLIEQLRRMGRGPTHVVAWSYGADVALSAALRAPEAFRSLFLYEPGYPGCLTDAELASFRADAEAMFDPVFGHAQREDLAAAVQTLIDGSGGACGYFDQQPSWVRAQQLDNAHTLSRQLHADERPDLSERALRGLHVRTTVAYGSGTRDLFRIVSKAVARSVPHARVRCVAGAGHMLPLENPRVFAQLLRECLAQSDDISNEDGDT